MNQYAQKEQDLQKAVAKGTRALYDIAKKAVDIWNDSDFHAWRQLDTPDAVEDYLDGILGPMNVTIGEVQAILSVFPKASQWGDQSFRAMYDEARRQIAAKQKEDAEERPQRTRTVPKLAEFKELQADREYLQKRAGELEKKLQETATETQSRLDELLSENASLKEENARLHGRIEELERLLNRQSVAA